MTLTEHALTGAVLRVGRPDGLPNRLPVGLPWYRSMPFSSLVGLELLLDGLAVAGVGLEVDGSATPIEGLRDVADRYWFLQDRRVLSWRDPAPIGERADVVLRIRLHLPNLTGPDGGSLQVLQEVRGVVPAEAAG